MLRDSTVFFGTSQFAVPILEALAQSEWRPRVVITAPDRPAGRGLKSASSPVKQKALALGLEVWEPERLKDTRGRDAGGHAGKPETQGPTWADRIRGLGPQFIVLAAYGLIIPKEVLASARTGSLNVHPSALPRWRGPAPIQHTILAGDAEAGVTVFLMDEETDHGPILTQATLPVTPDDTSETLEKKLSALGARLFLETLPRWLAGEITPRPQDHSRATFSKMIKKEDGLIDWSRPAEEINRRVRAFLPWPRSYTFWKRNDRALRLSITKVAPYSFVIASPSTARAWQSHTTQPGTVFAESKKLFVITGDGILEILDLQPEGKKPMSAQQFLNGYPSIAGQMLGGLA